MVWEGLVFTADLFIGFLNISSSSEEELEELDMLSIFLDFDRIGLVYSSNWGFLFYLLFWEEMLVV